MRVKWVGPARGRDATGPDADQPGALAGRMSRDDDAPRARLVLPASIRGLGEGVRASAGAGFRAWPRKVTSHRNDDDRRNHCDKGDTEHG